MPFAFRSALPFGIALACLGASCTAPRDAPVRTESPTARPESAARAGSTRPVPAVADSARWRGVVVDARRPFDLALLDTLASWGATTVVVCPYGFQAALDAPDIRGNGGGWHSESGDGIRTLAAEARKRGMRLTIKPHLWVGRGAFTGDIAMRSEADWQRWEAAYRAFVMPYARLSTEIGAEWFVVGTELGVAARTREAFWRGLADSVRTVFPGRITYAANWYGDLDTVPFWDALDAVGVQAYFPLAEGATRPDSAALVRAWTPHLALMEGIARASGKPVVFTEVGYRSVATAAREPWAWASRDVTETPDAAMQADLYRAFFAAVWPQPWFGGAVVWKTEPAAEQREGRHAVDFSPQGKPAARVLRRAWTAPPMAQR